MTGSHLKHSPLLAVVLAVVVCAGPPRREEIRPLNTLAAYAPADAGLFVELRNCEDLLIELTQPDLWLTLADFAGQPAAQLDTVRWRLRIRQTVDMDPAEAIRRLFAGGVAFIGEGPGRADDGVLICRPARREDLPSLVKNWNADPAPDLAEVYELPQDLAVALRGDVLLFGSPRVADGLFRRAIALSPHDGQSLRDNPDFQRLLARVPERPDGVLFVRMETARPPVLLRESAAALTESTTQPAAEDAASQPADQPTPPPEATSRPTVTPTSNRASITDSQHVLLALHREGRLLHFSAVGDAQTVGEVEPDRIIPLVGALPQDTLITWAGLVDYAKLAAQADRLPRPNIAHLALTYVGRDRDRLERLFDEPTCVALGAVEQAETSDAPPTPAVAVLLTVKDAEAAEQLVQRIAADAVATYNLLALRRGQQTIVEAETIDVGGKTTRLYDLSSLVAAHAGESPATVHLCWATDKDTLIIATHESWLRAILASRQGLTPRLTKALTLARRPVLATSRTMVVAQMGQISELCAAWLKYVQKTAPEALNEDWWRSRQPGGGKVLLGVSVIPQGEKRRVLVTETNKGRPAHGIVEPGDYITGCNGAMFSTDEPLKELVGGIVNRPNARWIELFIRRDGVDLTRRVPLPFVDPIRVMRQLAAIGGVVQRVVYSDDVTDAAGPRGSLTVELRKREMMFPPPPPPPPTASASASQPSPAGSPPPPPSE